MPPNQELFPVTVSPLERPFSAPWNLIIMAALLKAQPFEFLKSLSVAALLYLGCLFILAVLGICVCAGQALFSELEPGPLFIFMFST